MDHHPPIRRAPALRRGDRVSVVAPSGPVLDPARLEAGFQLLRSWGLEVVPGEHLLDQRGYLAGDDAARLTDLQRALDDPTTAAVIFARGGYGATRILGGLDFTAVRRRPKLIVGYSDITALHLAFWRHVQLVTLHGPMVTSQWDDPSQAECLRRALMDPAPMGRLLQPTEGPPLRTIVPGRASGRLVGGNLSLIAASLGTPEEIDTRDAIVLLEDVDEAPYRMDRMFTQLLRAGKLQRAAGIVIGESVHCTEGPPDRPSLTLDEVIDDLIRPLGIPTLYNLAIGHGTFRFTVPLGVRGTLDATEGWLSLDEAATLPPGTAP